MQTEIAYDFGSGERFPYQVLKARQVELAEENPGLYAWYLRVPGNSLEKLPQYARIFATKEIELVGQTGRFSERFNGSLQRVPSDEASTSLDASLLARATAALSPPMYIGISSNIRARLQAHFRELDRALWSRDASDGVQGLSAEEVDTARESKTFGSRVARRLLDQEIRDTRWLFVKILYSSEASRAELLSVEHALNHTFLPLCGVR